MHYIGPYRVTEHIATGGAADVFAATGPLGRVAIKQCRRNEARSRIRFQREIAALRQLRHRALVQVLDADESDNPPWYAMEDLGRVSLRQLLNTELSSDAHDLASMVAAAQPQVGPFSRKGSASLPHNLAITLIIEVGEAIGYAHSRGLIHRDIKPENIMMRPSGEAVIIDPGLVVEVNDDYRLTASGDALGTIAYMAPEQVKGKAYDERVDVFSLGQILLELLGGTLQTTSLLGKSVNRMRQAPALPKPLFRIIACAVEEDPNWRYASMAAFIADLIRYRNGESVLARLRPLPLVWWAKCTSNPRKLAVVLLPIVALAVLALAFFMQQPSDPIRWREAQPLIERYNTPDLRSIDGSWQRSGAALEAVNGGSISTTTHYPAHVTIDVSWENESSSAQSVAIECIIGGRSTIEQGWRIRCYHDGLVVLFRHGKPWWYRKFAAPSDSTQSLKAVFTSARIHLCYQDEPKVSLPIVSDVPSGLIGLRAPEGVPTRIVQWTVRVPYLPDYISSLDVVQNLIAEAEVSRSKARQAFVRQGIEMLRALSPQTEYERERKARLQAYVSWLTYAYNLQFSQEDMLTLLSPDDWFSGLSMDSSQKLAYHLAMGKNEAFEQFREMALNDPNFDAKAWSERILPLSPSNLDDYWWAIWTLIHRGMPKDDPQRLSFNRLYGNDPFESTSTNKPEG